LATSETYARLSTVMQKVFKQQDLIAHAELTARSVKGWDSLAHIRFILEVERAFGIKFATPEISKFKNVGELAEMVEKKQA
jgi:acyl carrier protein